MTATPQVMAPTPQVMAPTPQLLAPALRPAAGSPAAWDDTSPIQLTPRTTFPRRITKHEHLPIQLPPRTSFLRRIMKHEHLRHYNRLIVLVLLANVLVATGVLHSRSWWADDVSAITTTSRAVLANLALAILIRQQYVINLLFWLATRAPTSWPLRVRWTLGKVYHVGGLHVGGAVAGTLWFLVHAGFVAVAAAEGRIVSTATVAVTFALASILGLIVLTALPGQRVAYHDRFERVHRFGGWAALLLFWAHALLTMHDLRSVDPGRTGNGPLLAEPTVWVLLVLTASIALPWMRLRRVPVVTDRPSSHVVIIGFDHGVKPFPGSWTAISTNPLLEWHPFANVLAPNEDGFAVVVSRAGDWTGEIINNPPSRIWVKGIPTAGVANIEVLFKRVVYVATGSGVGPCVPHLLRQAVPAHLVWATRDPRATYGDALVDELLSVQPDAWIWDTTLHGKPDMVQLAYEACRATNAEAVICISNKKLTWEVVQGLEERGIPAYGAIWDS